jgi:hypothetical protein
MNDEYHNPNDNAHLCGTPEPGTATASPHESAFTVHARIRGLLPSNDPIINLYVGIRANISSLLGSPAQANR